MALIEKLERNSAKTCPACGQPIVPPVPDLTPIKQRILDAVKHRPGISAEELRATIWDDPSGGPEDRRPVAVATTARPATQAEKELRDNARLLRWWKAWHREQREAVLSGPHGAVLSELFRMFKNLKHLQPSQLIGFARSIDWAVIDADTKLVTLHELNAAITRFREKCNPDEPISDPLPNEPDSPYRTIKAILFPERAPTGAKPGMSIRNPAVLET
jgi:hypothetical protein